MVVHQISILGVAVIHLAQAFVAPPARYPHIHDYVFAAYSCGHFLLALVYCTYWQWTVHESDDDSDECSSVSDRKAKTE